MAKQFIPTKELSKYLDGSFEHLNAKLENALNYEKNRLFKETIGSVKIVGTFEGHVVAIVDGKKFQKVLFEKSSVGEIFFTGVEDLNIAVVEGDAGIRMFVRSEANRLVDRILDGKGDSSILDVKSLMQTMNGQPDLVEREQILNMIESMNNPKAHWRCFLEASEAGTPEVDFDPKFAKLSNPEYKISEGMTALVKSDIESLKGDLGELHSKVESLLARFTNISETSNKEDALSVKDSLNSLAGSVAEALVVLSEASSTVGSISVLGELYDSVRLNLHTQNAAYVYILKSVDALQTDAN